MPADRVPIVALVTGSWCAPCRPAPTVLRELARRWGTQRHCVLVEDPSDQVLDQLQVDFLPAWLLFEPASQAAGAGCDATSGPDLIDGSSPSGDHHLTIPESWRIRHRRTGALPKHVVDTEFGPAAAGTVAAASDGAQ